MENKFENTDNYIKSFPENIQKTLRKIRETIKNAAPEAEEKISYGMPTMTQYGVLVHYAAFKNHIGFYALPSGNEAFKKVLSEYKTGKGSIQFPLDKPIPLELIAQIVKFRLQENIEKFNSKTAKK